MEIKIEKLDNYHIDDFEYVTVTTTAPHLKKITYNRNPNCEARIRNIDKDHYEVIKTGDIKERKHTKKRSDSRASLRKTKQDIIDVINTNVTDINNCKFITLTYKKEMTDTKVFNDDINLFVKNFKYRYKTNKNIKVCVPQLRNSYHCHIIFIFDDVAPYIPYEELTNMWGKGNIDVKKIDKNVNNLGLYLASQICDLSLDVMKKYNIPYNERDVKCVWIENGKKLDKPKYYVKNGIANLIPPGFRILRISRNLKKPDKERMMYYQAKKIVGYRDPTYITALKLTLDNKISSWTNFIVNEFYNLKQTKPRSPSKKDLEVLKYLENLNNKEKEMWKQYEKSKALDPDYYDF